RRRHEAVRTGRIVRTVPQLLHPSVQAHYCDAALPLVANATGEVRQGAVTRDEHADCRDCSGLRLRRPEPPHSRVLEGLLYQPGSVATTVEGLSRVRVQSPDLNLSL